MKYCYLSLIVALFTLAPQTWGSSSKTSASKTSATQRKLNHVQSNGALAHPDRAPTEFSEDEINNYLASGLVALPTGVQSIRFSGEDGALTATTRIDFDQVKIGRHSSNPLLLVFSGTHDVMVTAHAHGSVHQGFVHVDSVQLDGVEIPEFILELFVEKYLQPKYPNIGIDSQFTLPDRIDTAKIGEHKLAITQK
jgi:hypothetical protein